MRKVSLLVSTGNLGDNIIEKGTFYEGVKRDIKLWGRRGTRRAPFWAPISSNPIEWSATTQITLMRPAKKGPMIVGQRPPERQGVNLRESSVRT